MYSPAGKIWRVSAQLLADGDLKPVVLKLFPWDKIAEAHLLVESGRARGKVVVAV
ncbi:zinc-binding dehydrogenase [Puia sp. P3]|uniref:zinc-binding dehydrogenase n=1 Tax=Puia sp. P3 TaxID=3423952 RepID=UPI003D665584